MIAISIESVSKAYRLGMIGGGTLREDISRWWARFLRRPDPTLRVDQEHHARHIGETFWALQDVSFEVQKGEVLGIIGRNGAGKSTLLKILSRVTAPTSGQMKVRGRSASLLEVGTGFHPELTGRENVFLNGAILGMTKAEVQRKFDEIVAFSEVEEFIDTPVKRYSSGMYVRLAFAVAAHLEPEIMIVDEVLAVGDTQFQKKCSDRMRQVARGGTTVILVSHNMMVVQSLSDRVLLLEAGRTEFMGEPDQAARRYLGTIDNTDLVADVTQRRRTTGREVAIRRVWVEDDTGRPVKHFSAGGGFTICMEVSARQPIRNPGFGFGIETADGWRVTSLSNYLLGQRLERFQHGTIRCTIRDPQLAPGSFSAALSVVEDTKEYVDFLQQAIEWEVAPVDVYKTGQTLVRGQGAVISMGDVTIQADPVRA